MTVTGYSEGEELSLSKMEEKSNHMIHTGVCCEAQGRVGIAQEVFRKLIFKAESLFHLFTRQIHTFSQEEAVAHRYMRAVRERNQSLCFSYKLINLTL